MLRVKDVMTKSVEIVKPETTLFETAEIMRRERVGALPVCDEDRLKGMITDRDIVVRGLLPHRHVDQLRVGDLMTREIHCCYEDDPLQEALGLMDRKNVRRLMVLNRRRRLAGIVSMSDIALEHPTRKRVEREFFPRVINARSPILYGSLVVGAVALLLGRRTEVRDRIRKVIPLRAREAMRVA